jgi:multicomponent Na+:H+ antiporter subunit F
VIAAASALLLLAAACFGYRCLAGPTLADRMIGVNGLLLVGMSAIAVHAVESGRGAFLPALVAVSLVGFIGTGMIARYLERRGW